MAQVGKAKVTFEGDFSSLEKDMAQAFDKVGKSAGKAAEKGTKAGVDAAKRTAEDGASAVERTGKSAEKAFDGVGGAAGKAADRAESEMGDMADTVARDSQRAGEAAAAGFDGVGDAARAAADRAEGEMGDMASETARAGARAGEGAAAGFDAVGSAARAAADTAEGEMGDMAGEATRAGARAGEGASAGFAQVGAAAGRAAEQAAAAMGGMAGDATSAGARAGEGAAAGFAQVGSAAGRAAEQASAAMGSMSAATDRAAASAQQAGAAAQQAGASAAAGAAQGERGFLGMDVSMQNVLSKAGRMAGAFAAIAGPAAVLSSGFDRLMDIERAEISFQNIGLSAEQTAAQMAQLSEQVTGTSVSLSDAAKYSAMFAQSGVEMGAPMNDTIQAFTNLASAAEGSGVDVGRVLQQMSAAGKVTLGDINQMSTGGINAVAYLADHLGMSMGEVRDAISAGEISFEDFVAAVNAGTGDLAKEMGDTLPAKIGNLKTAFANLGATLIEPFIPAITVAVEFGVALVKGVITPIKAVVAFFQSGSAAAQIFTGVLKALTLVVLAAAAGWGLWAAQFILWPKIVAVATAATAKFSGLLVLFKGGLLALRGALVGVWTALASNPIGWIIIAVVALVAAFVLLWNKSEAFRDFWIDLWNRIKEPIVAAIDAVKAAWNDLTGIFRGDVSGGTDALARLIGADRVAWIISTVQTVKQVWEDVKTAFGGGEVEGGGALARLVGIDTAERIMEIIGSIKGAWSELWAAFQGDGAGTDALTALLGDEGRAEFVVNLFTRLGDAARFVWDTIKDLGAAIQEAGASIASAGWDALVSVFSALWEVGQALWDALVQIGTAVWDLIQALAPVLMPILKVIGAVIGGIIVAAFVVLMGALKVVSWLFQALGAVISWLVENVLSPLISVIGTVVSWIAEKLGWAISGLVDIVTSVVTTIGEFFTYIWDSLRQAWEEVGQPVVDFIMEAFNFWWEGIKLGFRLLGAAFEVIWTGLQMAWEAWGQPVLDWIVGAFEFWWQGIQNVLAWLQGAWDAAWAFVVEKYHQYVAPVVDWIVGKFNDMRARIDTALNFVKSYIQAAADKVSQFYDTYVRPMVDNVVRGFNRVRDTVTGWKDKLVSALSGAGSWLVDAGRNVVQGFIDGIQSIAGRIGSAFLDLVPSWIKRPFMDALGISSPSRVFAEYGRNIGEGLVQGVESMQGAVAGATGDLAGAAASPTLAVAPVSVPAAAIAGPVAAGGPPVAAGGFEPPMGDSGGLGAAVSLDGETAQSVVAEQVLPSLDMMGEAYAATGAHVEGVSTMTVIPALTSVGLTAQDTAVGAVAPAAASMNTSLTGVGDTAATQAGAVINPALDSVAATAWATYSAGILPVANNIVGALNHVSRGFATAATNIASQWSRIREATAQPVRFVIRTVFNDGIVGMWNSVSDLLGTTRMAPYPVRFATGGYVRGPGGPTDDKIPALLSNREYVLNAKAVERIGVQNLNAMNSGRVHAAPNALYSRKQQAAMLDDTTFRNIASRYAGGGIVEGSQAWKDLLRGYRWAQSRSGRPYVWGGSAHGAGGTDCSGYMSGIADVILGGSGRRQWATGNFPATQRGAWAGGLASGFAVGIRNGGPGGGHTAGTIGGVPGIPAVNVESGGSPSRVKFGAGAVGATDGYFNQHHHLRVVDGGRFVPGMGSGPSMAQLAAEAMRPFKEKMSAAVTSFVGGQRGIWPREYPPKVEDKLTKATEAKIEKLTEEMLMAGADPGGAGVQRWAGLVTMLLKRYGLPEAWLGNTLRRMNQESGGNPRAINMWDINAKRGDPSKGLMQVIGSTFAAHRDPAFPNDIWHPTSNIAASMRYTMATYGSLPAGYDRAGGYHLGGMMPRGRGLYEKTAIEPERVLSPRQTAAFESLVDALDRRSADGIGWGGSRVAGERAESTRTVEVTQNIYSNDAETTARAVENRLAKVAW